MLGKLSKLLCAVCFLTLGFSVARSDDTGDIIEQRIARASTQPTTDIGPALGSGSGSIEKPAAPARKLTLYRLQYEGAWDVGFSKEKDDPLAIDFAARSGQPMEPKSIAIKPENLRDFQRDETPTPILMRGQGAINLTDQQQKALRTYLLDQHGAIIGIAADDGFALAFKEVMKKILPDVKPTAIPADDDLLKRPYLLKKVPKLENDATLIGWKVKGRWVAVLHPQDVGSLWARRDENPLPAEVDASFELGINLIFHAQRGRNILLQEQKGNATTKPAP